MTDGPWAVSQLTAWLSQIGPRVEALGPFELLELSPTDDVEQIRAAYHRIAATRHPDLFRGKLSADETEMLMRLFGRVSAAYATLRSAEERKKYGARPVKATPPVGTPAGSIAADGSSPPGGGLRKIAPRAMSHVRKAQAMLNTGDVASACLHLRMAVAADPQAKELRELLAETEAKLKR